jgi:two-component system response regulator
MSEPNHFQIVLAEDSQADAMLVRAALQQHGVDCELTVIGDGAEAISYFLGLDANSQSPAPGLVLLDMHLPKYDGEDILKALRSTKRIAQTPVIIMTSSTAPEIERMAQKHAALHYFRKPSTWTEFAELGRIVATLLKDSKRDRSDTAQT